jgi:hypothetical protein
MEKQDKDVLSEENIVQIINEPVLTGIDYLEYIKAKIDVYGLIEDIL